MLLKNKIFNIFFFLIILSQITPALIGQQYEYLILFFAFCFSFFIFHDDEKLFFNYLILFLLILLSFKLFKQLRFIEFGLLINKNMLADLRFFFVIFISFFVVKNSKLNLDQLLVLIFFLQLYLTFPNI